ncbi:MAG: CBS domain-containing protein [Chromatiales bacterium]|nr:CBS domain-containing protein [Gammaproteobacteria bacterium]MBW6475534.1 CBS domain-containing protein [Chromatiales bacterium]
MSEDRSSGSVQEERPRNWLERIAQILQSEPKDKDELLQLLQDAQQRNLIDRDAVNMIEGVLEVSEIQVRDIMIPRSQMEVIARDASLDEFLPVIIESAHSRFPVIGENRDEVMGIILAKDLLPFVAKSDNRDFDIREILRPAMIIPESKRLNVLLREFQTSHNHMAIVVDEYGGVAGLVTIEDVLEQIVGEIEDEHDVEDETDILPAAAEGCYSVRALTPIEDFNEHFRTDYSDEEFDTIGGLLMSAFGHMPKRGEQIVLDGLRFTVQRADNRRIYLLEVCPAPDEDVAEDDILPREG